MEESIIVITGSVIVKEETREVGANGFKKRLLVVQTAGQYPQSLPIDFVQDKTALLDAIQVGQNVKVNVNLRGSKSKSGEQWFPSIQGWKIE